MDEALAQPLLGGDSAATARRSARRNIVVGSAATAVGLLLLILLAATSTNSGRSDTEQQAALRSAAAAGSADAIKADWARLDALKSPHSRSWVVLAGEEGEGEARPLLRTQTLTARCFDCPQARTSRWRTSQAALRAPTTSASSSWRRQMAPSHPGVL